MVPLNLTILLSLSVAVILQSTRASSNTVAITHRSSSSSSSVINDYSNGLNVVKRHQEYPEEEYVTSFYKRVRDKRREMFGRQLQVEEDVAISKQRNLDHSLDHYFDQLNPSHAAKTSRKTSPSGAGAGVPSSNAARSVRGGGVAAQSPSSSSSSSSSLSAAGSVGNRGHPRGSVASPLASRADRGDGGSNRETPSSHSDGRRQQLGGHRGHPRARSRTGLASQGHGHRAVAARRVEDAYDEYDEYDEYDRVVEEGDDCPEHHLGLLRVPCSIAINSEEASLGHHDHDRHSSQSKTAMAAYVDTGAQVTIISAAAAKRAGIYHLMDRRYAGRATGVGHCKVLGRIPARHVHFILGCDNAAAAAAEDDEYRDDYNDNDYSDGYERRNYRSERHQEQNSKMVQMDGPALTVLEGTVTQGVDVLLGLDVLQDWEAEIRMGPKKSITVKKRRNRSGRGYYDGEGGDGAASVVIPFATSQRASGMRREEQARNARRRGGVHSQPARTAPHHYRQQQHKSYYSNLSDKREDIDDVEDDYSPTTDSDIESDLDLLDRSGGREFFPDDARNRHNVNNKRSMQEMEDEILGVVRSKNDNYEVEDDDDDDDDDYLRDVDEEDVYDCDDAEVDLSGL